MSIRIMDEEIRFYAKQLKIPTFVNYEDVLRQADPSLGLSGLLLELMKAECEARQENQNRRRLKAAGFPFQKTLDEFDFSQLNPSVSPEYIKELASCQFIRDKRNIVMIGNPSRGKTHLSIAFGLKACAMGNRVLCDGRHVQLMKHNQHITRGIASVLAAAALTAVAGLGWLSAADGEIVIIGIDRRALDELGPLPWPRGYMAEAIEYLNADPDARPAAIGVDVLYAGESSDPDADAQLAEAAAEYGNVVFASAATFGYELVHTGEGGFYIDGRAVKAWDEPFPALRAAGGMGHINAMNDGDGVLRHALLWVDAPGVGRAPSFARALYELWCGARGEEPNAPPETDAGGFFYLPFTAAPGGYYDGVSVYDLLSGEIESDYFADKLVLIGPYAAGLQDDYVTAVDHAAPMYGVEIQANQIDAFRSGFAPREVSGRLQPALLFALCAAALLFFWDRRVRAALPVWLAACALWVGACALLYRAGHILHVLYVPLFVTVLFVASVAANYVRAAREKRRVQNTFGHYIDPGVMSQLLEQGSGALELGGKLCDIAVLFVDVRGFTTMSEALDPPTVVEIINKYLTLTTDCIMRNHGTLDKFVGDCTMAFWNAPVAQEDAVWLACRAAMDMVEGSKALGEELTARFGRTVAFGVGVNWGPAVVGNIGAPKRMDYTAIGDTVNTAARLEANAPGGTVYISRAVADILGDRARTTSLGGTIKLKGKAEGFEILTLDELRD